MTEVRPERTPIATLICAFEAAIVVWATLGRTALYVIRTAGSARAHHLYPTSPLETVVKDLDVLLALAAAITLWQMRRSAFYLLATRFGLSFSWFAWKLLRGANLPVLHSGTRSMVIDSLRLLVSVCFLILSAAITWYVYRITKPGVEVTPIMEAENQIEEPAESPDENLSTARFYLASEEDQRKPR